MKIQINNKEVETKALNLSELAQEMALPEKGVAVAVNNKMVPRAQWADTALTGGIAVVIIKAACGG